MEAEAPDRHGFSLRYMDGFAVLNVPPENRRRAPVYADDVIARMKILGVPPVPARRIREIIESGSGEPEPLTPWPAGEQLNARVTISVDESGMEARAVVEPHRPGGAPANLIMVDDAMSEVGIIQGIDREACRNLIENAPAGTSAAVARGKPPVPGRPARTECLFITRRGIPWKELSGGRVDLKELNFIQNRKAGELLARHVPMVPPEDGFDVFGRVIEAGIIGKEEILTAGEGVTETEEGLAAAVDGNARRVDGTVVVEPLVFVKSVDYSTGNIDFDGSVAVEETVADGFSVRATGDLQVGRTVGRCRLSAGRNLVLRAGIVGDREGSCASGGNLYTRFLEGAAAAVGGDLVVAEAVLHSNVEVDGNLYLTAGRGEITGGTATVGGSVSCKRIGNVYSSGTSIIVGCPPGELRAFHSLAGELKTLRDETDELERQLGYLRSRTGSDSREIELIAASIEARNERMKTGSQRLRELRKSLRAADGILIAASDRIHPGTALYFGLEEIQLGDKGLERVILKRENGRTVVHGMRPGEVVNLPSS
jgi:uncharacterized protein (DUF342 family)